MPRNNKMAIYWLAPKNDSQQPKIQQTYGIKYTPQALSQPEVTLALTLYQFALYRSRLIQKRYTFKLCT